MMSHVARDVDQPSKAVERHMEAVFKIFYAAQAGATR